MLAFGSVCRDKGMLSWVVGRFYDIASTARHQRRAHLQGGLPQHSVYFALSTHLTIQHRSQIMQYRVTNAPVSVKAPELGFANPTEPRSSIPDIHPCPPTTSGSSTRPRHTFRLRATPPLSHGDQGYATPSLRSAFGLREAFRLWPYGSTSPAIRV